MEDETCVPKPYDIYVDNGEPITVILTHADKATCTVTPVYADNAPRDYGSVIQSLFGAGVVAKIPFAEEKKPAAMTPKARVVQVVELPTTHIKNTVATVTISCQVADANDTTTPLAAQRKVNIHYSNVDLLSASTGAIVSTEGKKI